MDPACGTGGFLLSTLNHIKDRLYQAFEEGDELNPDKKLREYASTHLFGVDIDRTVAKIAKVNMLMHGDGHTNIFRHDGLIDTKHTKRIVEFVDKNGGFEIVLTNPPFGGVKIDPEILAGYKLASHGKSEQTQILFIERCLNLLKPGGRMGIVLPDGILNSPSLQYVRDFVLENTILLGVVSLPYWTFMPYGANNTTSLLFIKKKAHPNEKQHKIVMMKVSDIGYNISGRSKGTNQLLFVAENLRQWLRSKSQIIYEDPLVFWLNPDRVEGRFDVDFYKPLPPTLEKLIASENTMLLKEVVTFEPRRLFSWDNVPGSDSERLIRFLGDNLRIAWAENAKILKSDDGKTIHIFKDDNSAEITLDEKREKAILKISGGRTHDLKTKKENGKLNIYENRTFKPNECSDEFFTYIEISDIDLEDGVIRSSKQLKCKNAPSRARMILKEGDIIISLTRPTRGAVIRVRLRTLSKFINPYIIQVL